MTLRNRTLVIIGATLLGLNAALYGISSTLLLGNSQRAEEQDTRQMMKGVLSVLSQHLEQFNDSFADWSSWDDAYQFIEDGNPDFIQSNLIDSQLEMMQINLIVFVHKSGRVVFGTGYDLQRQQKLPIPESIKQHLTSTDSLISHASPESNHAGIVMLPEGPMMIASRPIINSAGEGPIRGTLLVGRYLNQPLIERLEKVVRLPLQLHSINRLPPDVTVMADLPGQPQIGVKPLSETTIAGYALLNDLYHQPALVLQADNPRTVYQQGQATVQFLTWSLLVVGLVFCAVTLLLLERLVLARLTRLSQEVSGIGGNGDLSGRVSAIGRDELTELAGNINNMLATLEQYQQDRQRAAADLQQAKERAEEANRTKSQFLANMSHELRTPLNAIIGYSEMLKEDAVDFGQEDLVPDLDKIHSAGKHLLGLINDILDLSKIEAGKMDIYLETFDLSTLITEVVHTIQPLVQKYGNHLIVECPDDIGTMYADLTKLRQNLLNLLSNASKFTPAGTIRLTIQKQEVRPETDYPPIPSLVFEVADTGIGMSPDQMSRLFQAFTQADASTTRKYGGTGLGLVITQRFCQMMGGDITATSQEGKGSTFRMTIPQTVIDPSKPPVPAIATLVDSTPSTGHRGLVLVIDDDPTMQDLMGRLLSKEGFRVEAALSAEAGLQKARELHPNVITLDVMMPEIDGWSALATLKSDPALAEIPVIMVTMVDHKNKGYALGAADYLTKPIDRSRLASVLKRYQCQHPPCKILLVEDDPTTSQMMQQLLHKEGWQVVLAANGRIALEQLGKTSPELILLDLMMPEMDGFAVVAAIQNHPVWRTIPIIVLTAKDITPEERCRLQGSVEQIVQKGAFDREKLLVEIRNLVTTYAKSKACVNADR